jgi:hypothetical protein
MSSQMSGLTREQLDAMVDEATVDCYNEDEQVTGLFTMLEDPLAMPFETLILGFCVTVESVDLTADGEIVAVCTRDGLPQSIPILDLPLPNPSAQCGGWIGAYRRSHG